MSEKPSTGSEGAQPAAKPRWRSGWVFSAIFHLGLLALLIWAPLQLLRPNAEEDSAETASTSSANTGSNNKPAPKETIAEALPAEKVREAMQRKIKEQQNLPPEKRQAALKENAKRFELMSNEESVDEMARKFNQWMETSPRATQPADNPPPGPFNHKTAQMYDLTRAKNANGAWEYSCVLLDADGRTMTIPPKHFDQKLGHDLYPTFEVMKQNPLTRQIYEKIVMGLFDEMLKKESKQ